LEKIKKQNVAKKMENKRNELIVLLGERNLPGGNAPLVVRGDDCGGYILETLMLDLNGVELVPAYLAFPKTANGKVPLVLFNHSHGGNFEKGKDELIKSSGYLQKKSFADEITGLGYAAACIDMWGFGGRQGKKESELVKESLLYGRPLWGMRIFDNIEFLSYLLTREEIDETRIASIGMSMGGLMSWWHTAVDERIKISVDIAAQVEVEALIKCRKLDKHNFYYYLPGFLKHFSTLDVQKLIAPRPRLSIYGKDDEGCPADGVKNLEEGLKLCYKELSAEGNFIGAAVTGGHQETAETRKLWIEFLKDNL
jgi:pimeloyl-ACP methyl ester carboxylesterase